MRILPTCFLFVFALVSTGCARNYPVKGRVEFGDGTPLAGGMVVLTSEDGKRCGYGILKGLDGRFEISFDKLDDGIPAGRYQVAISRPSRDTVTPDQIRAAPGPDWGIKDKYTRSEESGLEVVIEGKLTDYVIRLEKSPPPSPGVLAEWRRQRVDD